MDKITQQNAALVEEAAAAAKSMEEQTDAMANLVAEFVLDASFQAEAIAPQPVAKPRPEPRAARGRTALATRPAPVAQADDWKEF
jgi:methyl-accepting chemotaxis protein